MDYDRYKALETAFLGQDFDPFACAERVAGDHLVSVLESLKNVMHLSNLRPDIDRAWLTRRVFSVWMARSQQEKIHIHFSIKVLLTYGPVLPLAELKELRQAPGPFSFNADDLNAMPDSLARSLASSLNINTRHFLQPESVRYLVSSLWGWFGLQEEIHSQASRCTNAAVLGELVTFEPFAKTLSRCCLKPEALADERVLAHVVAYRAYKESDSFRVLSAGIRAKDDALFTATLESVAGWSENEKHFYYRHGSAQAMSLLLNKYFGSAVGETRVRVDQAKRFFSEIGEKARGGREHLMSAVGMER